MIILQCISDRWIAAHFCLWEYVKILIASCSVFSAVCFCWLLNKKTPNKINQIKKQKGLF